MLKVIDAECTASCLGITAFQSSRNPKRSPILRLEKWNRRWRGTYDKCAAFHAYRSRSQNRMPEQELEQKLEPELEHESEQESEQEPELAPQ
jgi:hypothetical protein